MAGFHKFQKKGVVEVQLNWVFILFAGAIILLFFASAASWYKATKEKELAMESLEKIETVISESGHATTTSNRINVPNIELVFDCDKDTCNDEGCSSNFGYSGVDRRETPMNIIFSPKKMKSDFLYPWTLEHRMPFKVTNYLYLTNPSMKYVLVYDSGDATSDSEDAARRIYNVISESNVSNIVLAGVDLQGSVFTEVKNIEYNNEYLLRFVFFFDPGSNNIQMDGSVIDAAGNWDVVYLMPETGGFNVEYGEIVGGVWRPSQAKAFRALSDEDAIGAIYTEDYGMYVCNMKKAMLKSRVVSEVYRIRTEKLYEHYNGQPCQGVYGGVELYFADLEQELGSSFDAGDYSSSAGVINSKISGIKDANDLSKMKSCPRIY